MPKLIISAVGNPNSGKTSALWPWAKNGNVGYVRGSNLLLLAAEAQDVILRQREDYETFHRTYRAQPGNRTFVADTALADAHPLVFIDGLRNIQDAMKLERAKDVAHVIVKFWAPIEVRFGRIDPEDPKNAKDFDTFLAQDIAEYGDSSGLDGLHLKAVSDMNSHVIDTTFLSQEQSTEMFADIVRSEAGSRGIILG